jgi:micrococcal nuclease
MWFERVIILVLMISSFWIFWIANDKNYSDKEIYILRVIDGDTVETSDGTKIRLLGINTPEKNMFLYTEAINFTKNLMENKTLVLKSSGEDKYGRILGYLFEEKINLNEKIISEGFAHSYFYGDDGNKKSFLEIEKIAREKEIGIWNHSENYGCLEIVEFEYLDKNEYDNESLILKNSCNLILNVLIKDDATHIYKEKIIAQGTMKKITKDIWNDDGDSIYIWDSKGLVLFYRY